MRMLITVEFADAGPKSGAHRILTISRRLEEMQSGNLGLSLEEAKSLVSAVHDEFVAAQRKFCRRTGNALVARSDLRSRTGNYDGSTPPWGRCSFRPHVLSRARATAPTAAPYRLSKAGSRGRLTS